MLLTVDEETKRYNKVYKLQENKEMKFKATKLKKKKKDF